jgi:hypothetical protein
MTQNPAEHHFGQAANQNRLTCGFVLFRSSANFAKTQDLFFIAKITAKTRFPAPCVPHTREEFLPGVGKIFTMAARSSYACTPA